jgi:hypothetical protein
MRRRDLFSWRLEEAYQVRSWPSCSLPYSDGWGLVTNLGDEIPALKVRLVQRHPVNPEHFVVIFTKAPTPRRASS